MCTPTRQVPSVCASMESASSRSRAVGGSMEKMRAPRRSRRHARSAARTRQRPLGRHAVTWQGRLVYNCDAVFCRNSHI